MQNNQKSPATQFDEFAPQSEKHSGQPIDSHVLTASGWKRIVDLSIGEKLSSIDGQPSEVTDIAPQRMSRLFEFSFSDGRSCHATDGHPWEVMYRDWSLPCVKTTLELVAMMRNARYQNRLSVRLFNGDFGHSIASEFSPWLLGVLLGDGCFRAGIPTMAGADQPLLDRVAKELRIAGCELRYTGQQYDYRIVDPRMGGRGGNARQNRVRDWLASLDLWGKLSQDKLIPTSYMSADKHTRQELLKGLMDTDGTAGTTGGAEFSSSSLMLAIQVRDLVRSLGGKANLRPKTTTHLDHYRVSVIFKDRSQIFYLPRKLERVLSPRTKHIYNRLTLRSITEVKPGPCQAISVSHRDNLYIADNYVVTRGVLN
ncbi:LAGLIDADG family homing endonuclease [Paraburkholderia sp. SIMBA_054]|uniref:LAGLIDADG family homing endonuclease n=1 Tax=Paraburkholderia sp. SIMBA_054 TaxID=3085795 RepID=UPI00397A36C8